MEQDKEIQIPFEAPSKEKHLGDMKLTEKNYNEAINLYTNSISLLKKVFDQNQEMLSKDDKKATELIETIGIPAHLNIALCYLQLEDWQNVILYCTKVIELNPNHIKAIYRRCKAYIHNADVINLIKF
jgi:tetratricopeptide (TPR) repeat protein